MSETTYSNDVHVLVLKLIIDLTHYSLRRHSLSSSRNPSPPRTSAGAKRTFLAFVDLCLLASRSRLQTLLQRSAGDQLKITLEPNGAAFTDSRRRQRFQSGRPILLITYLIID